MQYCHEWTIEEDKYCCRIYTWYMFTQVPKTQKQADNLATFTEYQVMTLVENPRELITMIWRQYPTISEKEILFQLRKIKQISMELLGDDAVPIIPAKNYRMQLKNAFCITMDEISFELRHEPPAKTREELWTETQEYIRKYGKIIVSQDPDDFLGGFGDEEK